MFVLHYSHGFDESAAPREQGLEMKMTTIAQQIAQNFKNFADATNEADRLACDKDQDWENETTVFKFEDGSALKACHPFVEVVSQ
jgi:hypothetical protein